MPEQPMDPDRPEHRYDETVAPSNPPNSVLRPAVRRTALWTYLGIVVAFFLVVGAALVFLVGGGRGLLDDDDRTDPNAVGTSGERMAREGTPGGFDPDPDRDSTRSELEFRGAGEPSQGPMPGLRGLRDQSGTSEGRRIELDNVEVERVSRGTFWVRDGDQRAAVITSGGMPAVRAGQRVDISGTVERSGDEVRIRASRIDVK